MHDKSLHRVLAFADVVCPTAGTLISDAPLRATDPVLLMRVKRISGKRRASRISRVMRLSRAPLPLSPLEASTMISPDMLFVPGSEREMAFLGPGMTVYSVQSVADRESHLRFRWVQVSGNLFRAAVPRRKAQY